MRCPDCGRYIDDDEDYEFKEPPKLSALKRFLYWYEDWKERRREARLPFEHHYSFQLNESGSWYITIQLSASGDHKSYGYVYLADVGGEKPVIIKEFTCIRYFINGNTGQCQAQGILNIDSFTTRTFQILSKGFRKVNETEAMFYRID